MAPKQTSLFDFFESPVEKYLQPQAAVVQTEQVLVVDEQPVEIEFETPITLQVEIENTNTKNKRGRKKLSEINAATDFIDIPEDDILFQKKYYSIGIVAEMFKVNISHIRFWEKEFDILKPKLNGKGDRHFRPEDVKNLQLIHHLLREKKYTIEGAKDFLKKNKKVEDTFELIEGLKKINNFLTELKLSL